MLNVTMTMNDGSPGLGLPEKYDGGGGGGRGRGSKSLRMPFSEAVYGFWMSFLNLCIFLGYEFNVMAVSGAVYAFH